MKNYILSFLIFVLSCPLQAQIKLMQNSYNRETTSLNGKWHYIVDPYELGYRGYRYMPRDQYDWYDREAFYNNSKPVDKTDRIEYDFDKSGTLKVPGDWNSQAEKLFYYEGTVWYKRSFDYKKANSSNRVFLHFGAINYEAHVYLNGKKLGVHRGGFTPFEFEITEHLTDTGNYLIVKVDNTRKKEAVPTLNTDWWNYGGITRDVKIIEVPQTFIADYKIQLKKGSGSLITGYVQLEGSDKSAQKVQISIPDLGVNKELTTNQNGYAEVSINSKTIKYWSPENPKLYLVQLKAKEDELVDKIGFRTISTQGHDLLLNGKSIFLRGISIHEENPIRGGRAYSIEDARILLGWAKELGCNFVRLAHYPHNENMARLADEIGLLVWEENPVYWTISWDNLETYQTAEKQLKELITRDKNRASVIIWSMANETPRTEKRLEFLRKLTETTRNMDDTRLISAALEKHTLKDQPNTQTIGDPFEEYVDVLSFNQYIGWYDGLPDKCAKTKWLIEENKPVIISEYGAGALQGFHGDSLTRWSEEYQEYLYRETIKMLEQIPQLRGTTPWILADFRSPRRLLPDIQDGWNRKGLISETGNKKKAFYVLRDYYKQKKVEFSEKDMKKK